MVKLVGILKLKIPYKCLIGFIGDFLVSFIRLEIFRFYAKTFVYGYKSINSTDFASDMIKFKDLYAGPEYYFYYRVA